MLRSRLSWAVAAIALCTVPSIANAEVRPADLSRPAGAQRIGPGYGKAARQFRVDTRTFVGNVNVGPEDRGQFIIAPMLFIAEPRGENEFEFRWGFTTTSGPSFLGNGGPGGLEPASTFRLSNPSLVYFWTWRTLSHQLRLGLGGTLPTAIRRDDKPPQSNFDEYAFAATSLMEGQRDLWHWKFNTMSAILHFDAMKRHWFGLIYGVRLVAAPMYEAWDRPGDSLVEAKKDGLANGIVMQPADEIELVGQAEVELAFDTRHVRIGVVASYVQYVTGDADDSDLSNQMAVEPEFRVRLGSYDLLVGGTLPIDPPSGFALDPGRFWNVRIGFASPTELLLPAKPDQ